MIFMVVRHIGAKRGAIDDANHGTVAWEATKVGMETSS